MTVTAAIAATPLLAARGDDNAAIMDSDTHHGLVPTDVRELFGRRQVWRM